MVDSWEAWIEGLEREHGVRAPPDYAEKRVEQEAQAHFEKYGGLLSSPPWTPTSGEGRLTDEEIDRVAEMLADADDRGPEVDSLDEPDGSDPEVRQFMADLAERAGIGAKRPEAAAVDRTRRSDHLPPLSYLRRAVQQLEQLGYRVEPPPSPSPDAVPAFAPASLPPQLESFQRPRLAHSAWRGWQQRFAADTGQPLEAMQSVRRESASLMPAADAVVKLELVSHDDPQRRVLDTQHYLPFGAMAFADGSYCGGSPAVHKSDAIGSHWIPSERADLELVFGFVLPGTTAGRGGRPAPTRLVDVRVWYRDRCAREVTVRVLEPDDLGDAAPAPGTADRPVYAIEALRRPEVTATQEAFCIFPLFPRLPACRYPSSIAVADAPTRPLDPETLSRYEVDLDKQEIEDPELGQTIEFLKKRRSAEVDARGRRKLSRLVRSLLERERARVAACPMILRRTLSKHAYVDGVQPRADGEHAWTVPNVEETFVPRHLLALPGGVLCLIPERVPRVGYPWDAEVWLLAAEEEGEDEEERLRLRRMVRSYSPFGDFIACALTGTTDRKE